MPQTNTLPPSVNPLPKPSSFLTNLLATLSALPKTPSPEAGITTAKTTSPAKPYLLTLHALFPSTLLPALDLLDRRLITQLVLAKETEADEEQSTSFDPKNGSAAPQAPTSGDNTGHETTDIDTNDSIERLASGISTQNNREPHPPAAQINHNQYQTSITQNKVYYVKSSQSQHFAKSRRFSGYSSEVGGGTYDFDKSYEVRPWAWSCTCAAFAFAAYNAEDGDDFGGGIDGDGDDVFGDGRDVTENRSGDLKRSEGERDEPAEGVDGEERTEGRGWGGLMAFYRDREEKGDVPLCKHLLACVLAEFWAEARDLVEVKNVARAEMAGWAAGWGG